MLAGLATGLLVLLVIASHLQPDPRGYGTHRQLGWPACAMNLLFGIRCPSCGMTTSWAHLVRGDFAAATKANTGGTVLGVMAVIAIPWITTSATTGRWLWGRPRPQVLAMISIALVVTILLDWLWRLLRG